MANPQIKFYKGAAAPTSPAAGVIWFNTKNRTIQVYTGTDWEIYTGLVDATFVNGILTVTKASGDPVVLDFSDVASGKALADLKDRVDDYDTWKTEVVTPVISTFNEQFATVKTASETNAAKLAGLTKNTVKAEITADIAVEAQRVDGVINDINETIDAMDLTVKANEAAVADYASFKENHKTTVDGYIDSKINALGGDKTGSDEYVSVQVTTSKGEVSGVIVNTDALSTKIDGMEQASSDLSDAIDALGKKVGAPVAVEGQSAYSESYTVAQDIKAAKDAAAAAQADIDAFLAGVEIGTDKVVDTLKEIQHFLEGEDGTVATLLDDVSKNRDDIDVAKAQLAGIGENETVKNLIANAKSEVVDGATEGYATLGDLEVKVKALEGAVGTENSVAEAIEDAVKPERERIDAYDTWRAGLEVTDAAVEGQYVSQVKQVDGKIEVTRAALPDWTNTINGAVTTGINALDSEAKDEAGYITGSVKQVDGKLTELSLDASVGEVASGEDKLTTAASVKTYVDTTFS